MGERAKEKEDVDNALRDPGLHRLLDAMDLAVQAHGDHALGGGVGPDAQRSALRLRCLSGRLDRDPAASAGLQALARAACIRF